jgi:hypothetical protein
VTLQKLAHVVQGLTRNDQDWMNVSKSLFIVSACGVGIPCGEARVRLQRPVLHQFAMIASDT